MCIRDRYKGDEIARATACDGLLRAIAVSSRDMVERARNIHMTLPVVTAALGRAPVSYTHLNILNHTSVIFNT